MSVAAPRVVWKIPLRSLDRTVSEPLARPVTRSAGLDATGQLCVWIEHDWPLPDDAQPVRLTYTVVGTGHGVPLGDYFVGTAVIADLGLVLHVYEGRRT